MPGFSVISKLTSPMISIREFEFGGIQYSPAFKRDAVTFTLTDLSDKAGDS